MEIEKQWKCFAGNVEPPAPQSVPSEYSSMRCITSLTIKCRQKAILLVSIFTKHNEPVCIFGYTVTGLKAKKHGQCRLQFSL